MALAPVGTGVGLARVAARRVRADLPLMMAAWLVLSAATTLTAAAFQYSDAVATGGLRRAVLDAPAADRGVSVQTTASPAQVADLDAKVSGVLGQALGPVAPVTLAGRSGSLAPLGATGEQAAHQLTVLGAYAGLDAHARLTAGRWADGGATPVEATLSDGAARAMGLAVGDRLALVDASTPGAADTPLLTVVVTGTWTADPEDPYWLGDPLDINGIVDQGAIAYRGPLMVAPSDLYARGLVHALTLTWRAGLAIDRLEPADVPPLERALPALQTSVAVALPANQPVTVGTGLAGILSGVERSLTLAKGGVTLLALQFIVLAIYAVMLIASMLAERRRHQDRILRARGATWYHLLGIAAGEAALAILPAVAVAPFAAALAVQVLAVGGPLAGAGVTLPFALSEAGTQAAVLAGLVAALILVVPALPTGGRIAAIRITLGREGTRIPGQRFGLDLALVAVAGIALWQLRLYGSPVIRGGGGELGVDPLLVAGPAIGLAACSLLATRALPRLARLAEGLLVRRRSLVPQLGAHELARRPLRSVRATLLVMLAVGLTTFSVVYDATWFRSQADQAAYQAAADVRVVTPAYPAIPEERLGAEYRAVDGVTAAMPVMNGSVVVGGPIRTADLLGVDASTIAGMVDLPGGASGTLGAAFGALAAARPVVAAIALPGTPRRLAVTLDGDLSANVLDPSGATAGILDPSPTNIAVNVVVIDADGRVWRSASTGQAAFAGAGQRLEIPVGGSAAAGSASGGAAGAPPLPAGPLRLEAIEVVVTPPEFDTTTTGTIDIRGVQASDGATDAAGSAWTDVAFDPGGAGWAWLRIDPLGQNDYTPPTGSPARIRAGTGGTRPIFNQFVNGDTTWRAYAVPSGDLTVGTIASSSFLAASGQPVGATLTGSIGGNPAALRIDGVAGAIPPLDPTKPALVVDSPTLALVDYAANGAVLTTAEWWLSVAPDAAGSVAHRVAAAPFSAAQVVSREDVALRLQGDPVALGVVGALLLGAVAAMVLAAVGFLVSASAALEARADELGLLRAIGLSDGQLVRWLAIEQALLLAVGVIAGIALGTAFAWVVLPAATFTPTGARPVPDPELVVPLAALAAMAVGSVALLAATVLAARRRLGLISVAETLRAVIE